jgi:hypothetical protein
MRLVSLLRLAAQAESLRWRRMGRGYAIQAGLGAGAALFGLMLLLMLHLAIFAALARRQSPEVAALIVAAGDLVLAGILGWLAARHAYDPVAVEAERVRDEALRQASDTTARTAMLVPLLRSQSAKKGLVGAAMTAAVVGLLTRR